MKGKTEQIEKVGFCRSLYYTAPSNWQFSLIAVKAVK